jgi:hypothetical protein
LAFPGQGVPITSSALPADFALTAGAVARVQPAPVAPDLGHVPAPGSVTPATGTGSGFGGLSIFLILAGLLMVAAPRTKRRLRLASEPWRPAPFVLIPERPG